jgi:hypothetical protein
VADTATGEDSVKQFEKTPKGYQELWQKEMEASEKMLEKFHESGDKIYDKYLDKRGDSEGTGATRLNLFHSGIGTIKAMLYGQVPKIDFDRRYADSSDDVARVASEMYERILNADVERPDDDYTAVLKSSLLDRLVPGMGQARVRYEAEFEKNSVEAIVDPETGVELAPAYEEDVVTSEKVCVDYVHWKDFRYSYARTWAEVRWVAFRAWMSYDELVERFGEEKAKKVPLRNQYPSEQEKESTDAWQKGEIWEIWCRDNKTVYWYSDGMTEILETKEDPLKLRTFFPCPRPMIANPTTNLMIARADYSFTQDLYKDIDELQSRIRVLTKAVRLVGIYDKNNPELNRVLKEAADNEMIAVENWAMFAEKRGLEGAVSWFPLEEVVATLDKLRELRDEQIALLYQVTGLSDIMRGQSSGSDRVSATEQSIKAKFASVRVQALQDEFAQFGTDLIRLKGEVMAKHFQPQNIVEASNILRTPDAEMAMPALELLKNHKEFIWRVHVRPESLAMVDYQALQAERVGYLTAVSTFMQSAAPLAETLPGSLPVMLELLQWGLAGFKGSQQIEGVMDRAITAAKQPQPEKPDPAMVKAQADMQAKQQDAQLKQQEAQMRLQEMQAQFQADMQKAQMELQQDREKHQQEMQQDREKFQLEMQQMMQKANVERQTTVMKLEADAVATQQKLETDQAMSEQKIRSAKEQANAKKLDSKSKPSS